MNNTFTNPLSFDNYSDPFITYDDYTGYYYFISSCQCDDLVIFRHKDVGKILKEGESKVVYSCGKGYIHGPMWAPEMYKIGDHWYIYTSCQVKHNDNTFAEKKRLLILKSNTLDPFDGFTFVSKPDTSIFAIDPTSTFINGKQYICYSRVVGCIQALEIREMDSPTSFTKNKAVISTPSYKWEKAKGYDTYMINEGAFFLKRNNRLFIIYSANGCWSDDYCLGLLEYKGGEVCNKDSWVKYDKPVFVKGNNIFGVGHASFFDSPNKKEVWCAYHCLLHSNPELKEMDRQTCIQKIDFDENDFPLFGEPVGINKELETPN